MAGVIDQAITEFARLPGIGKKSAQRLVYSLLRSDRRRAEGLSKAITQLMDQIRPCSECGLLTEVELCDICSDSTREEIRLCVVQESSDVAILEASGKFKGRYHILGGLVSPVNQVFPEQLNITALLSRVTDTTEEVILALSANSDGEYTVRYLAEILKPKGVKITSLAKGIPMGSALEFADKVTLGYSLEGRVAV